MATYYVRNGAGSNTAPYDTYEKAARIESDGWNLVTALIADGDTIILDGDCESQLLMSITVPNITVQAYTRKSAYIHDISFSGSATGCILDGIVVEYAVNVYKDNMTIRNCELPLAQMLGAGTIHIYENVFIQKYFAGNFPCIKMAWSDIVADIHNNVFYCSLATPESTYGMIGCDPNGSNYTGSIDDNIFFCTSQATTKTFGKLPPAITVNNNVFRNCKLTLLAELGASATAGAVTTVGSAITAQVWPGDIVSATSGETTITGTVTTVAENLVTTDNASIDGTFDISIGARVGTNSSTEDPQFFSASDNFYVRGDWRLGNIPMRSTLVGLPFTGPSAISVNPVELTLLTSADPVQFYATVHPADVDYQEVTWSSTKPEFATVGLTGIVTPVAESGALFAQIRATDYTGTVYGQCGLAVKEPHVPVTYYVGTAGSNTAPYNTRAKAAKSFATIKPLVGAGDTVYVCDDAPIDASSDNVVPWAAPVHISGAPDNAGMPIVIQKGLSGICLFGPGAGAEGYKYDTTVEGIKFIGVSGQVPGLIMLISSTGVSPYQKYFDGVVCSGNIYDYSMCTGVPAAPPLYIAYSTCLPPLNASVFGDGIKIENNLIVYPLDDSANGMALAAIYMGWFGSSVPGEAEIVFKQNTVLGGWKHYAAPIQFYGTESASTYGQQRVVCESNIVQAVRADVPAEISLCGVYNASLGSYSSVRDNDFYGDGAVATNYNCGGAAPIMTQGVEFMENIVTTDPVLLPSYEPTYHKTWGWQGWRGQIISSIPDAKSLVATARGIVSDMSAKIEQMITLVDFAIAHVAAEHEAERVSAGLEFVAIWDTFDTMVADVLYRGNPVFSISSKADVFTAAYNTYLAEYRVWPSSSDAVFVGDNHDTGSGIGFACHFNSTTSPADTLAYNATYHTYGFAAENYHSIVTPQVGAIGMFTPSCRTALTPAQAIFGVAQDLPHGTLNAFKLDGVVFGSRLYGTLENKLGFIRKLLTGEVIDYTVFPDPNGTFDDWIDTENVRGRLRIEQMGAMLDKHDAWLDAFGTTSTSESKYTAKTMRQIANQKGSMSKSYGRYRQFASTAVGFVPGMVVSIDNDGLLVPVSTRDRAKLSRIISAVNSSASYRATVTGATVLESPSVRLEVTTLAVSKPLTPGQLVAVMIYGNDIGKLISLDQANPGIQTVVAQCVTATETGWEIETVIPYVVIN